MKTFQTILESFIGNQFIFYCADHPPSTGIAVPVIVAAVSEVRNKLNSAMVSTGTNSFMPALAG
jgi:hypothetical protein